MAKKKSDQVEESTAQRELERHVDTMMSVEAPAADATEAAPAAAKTTKKPKRNKSTGNKPAKPADAEQPTAPPLPPNLLKTISNENEAPDDISADNEPEPEESTEPDSDDAQLPDALEDNETDQAVDDIVASEADTQLAVDDAWARRRTAEANAAKQRGLLAIIFTSPWIWLIIVGVAGVTYAWYH